MGCFGCSEERHWKYNKKKTVGAEASRQRNREDSQSRLVDVESEDIKMLSGGDMKRMKALCCCVCRAGVSNSNELRAITATVTRGPRRLLHNIKRISQKK